MSGRIILDDEENRRKKSEEVEEQFGVSAERIDDLLNKKSRLDDLPYGVRYFDVETLPMKGEDISNRLTDIDDVKYRHGYDPEKHGPVFKDMSSPYGGNYPSEFAGMDPSNIADLLQGSLIGPEGKQTLAYTPDPTLDQEVIKSTLNVLSDSGLTEPQLASAMSQMYAPSEWIPSFYEQKTGKSWTQYNPLGDADDGKFKMQSQLLIYDAVWGVLGRDTRTLDKYSYRVQMDPKATEKTGKDYYVTSLSGGLGRDTGLDALDPRYERPVYKLTEEQEEMIAQATADVLARRYTENLPPPTAPQPTELMLKFSDNPPPAPMARMAPRGKADPFLFVNPYDGSIERYATEESAERAKEQAELMLAADKDRIEKYNNEVDAVNKDVESYEVAFKQYERDFREWQNGFDTRLEQYYIDRQGEEGATEWSNYLENFWNIAWQEEAVTGGSPLTSVRDRMAERAGIEYTKVWDYGDRYEDPEWGAGPGMPTRVLDRYLDDDRILDALDTYVPLDFEGKQDLYEKMNYALSKGEFEAPSTQGGAVSAVDVKREANKVRQGQTEFRKQSTRIIRPDEKHKFRWYDSRGRLRGSGVMMPEDIGLSEYMSFSQQELLDMYKEDPAYNELMNAEMPSNLLSAMGLSKDQNKTPFELIDEIKGSNPGKGHEELMKIDDYKLAFNEIGRRRGKYANFHMSMWVRDHIYKNAAAKRGQEGREGAQQSAAVTTHFDEMEKYILKRFGLMVPLTSDNIIGLDEFGVLSTGMASYGQGTVDMLSGGIGGIMEWAGDAFDQPSMSRAGSQIVEAGETMTQDVQAAKTQFFFDRQLYSEFGDSNLNTVKLDDSSDGVGVVAATLGLNWDDFTRQEFDQAARSLPVTVWGANVALWTMGRGGPAALGTAGASRFIGLNALKQTFKFMGTQQIASAAINSAVVFGQKYHEVRDREEYQTYTDASGKEISLDEAKSALASAQAADPNVNTYEDAGISVERDFSKAWGAASVNSAAETVPEVGAGLVTRWLAGLGGPSTIAEGAKQRLVNYALSYAASMGWNLQEEGATEWVTSMSQDYADSVFEGRPFNLDAALENAHHSYVVGQKMAFLGGGSMSAISTVQTERNILKNIENDPTWIKQQNLRSTFARQHGKISKQGKKDFNELQRLRQEARDPSISDSYRDGLETEITRLEAKLMESDAQAYEMADKLLEKNVGLAEQMRATNQAQLLVENMIQQAVDNNAPQEQIDILIEQQMLLQEKMDTYMNAATLAIEEKTVATVRDGSNTQTETEVTSRPATKAEADMVFDNAAPPQDEQTESQQNEAEQNVQEYDDDLDRIVREEEDYMVINGVDENGALIYEGQNEDNTEFTGRFQEGVIDLLKSLSKVNGNQTSTVLYGTTEAFNQDPNVQAYVAEHGKQPAALAVFGPDGTKIEKILISPETTRQQAIHEAAHASMREILNDPAARTDMTQKILDLADQKGNRRFRAWVNSLIFDYASPEARERRKNGGKLTAEDLTPMEQEELIVEFQSATATNDWVVTGGRSIELSKTARQRLEDGFWRAMSKLSSAPKNLNFAKNTSLAELTERFKRAMPAVESKPQAKTSTKKSSGPNVIVPNTEQEVREKANTPNKNKPTVGKPSPQTNPGGAAVVTPEHSGHVVDNQGVRASSDAINTSKQEPITVAPTQTTPSEVGSNQTSAIKTVQEPSPRRPEESDQQYRERLEQEANQLLEGTADIETPETDALSQETDQIDGTSVAALERGRQDFISGKKVTGVYYNGFGYPRTFQMTPNDYFHFRNWHNKITGNGAQPFAKLFYTTESGEVKTLRTPKPKLDKQGNPVVMKPVDIRTALRKFGDARIALVQAKSTLINERTNRLNRVLEIAKENGITYDQLGLKGPYPGSNSYAEVEQAEVVLQAMLNPTPGTAYPMGLVSPKVEDWQMLTPKSLEDLQNGKKRGYGALDRRGKRGGSDRTSFVRDYGFGTMMQDRDGGMRPALSTSKNFDEARAAVVTNYNIGDARMPVVTVNYAPTEVGTASFTWTPRGETEAKTMTFRVPGGIMRPVVDALDYKKRNGREGGAIELVGPTFTSKSARNAVENHFQDAREAIDMGAQGISNVGLVLVKMLATDNPYGDPLIFQGIISVMDAIIAQDPEALPVVVKELNKILLKSKMGRNNPLMTKTQEGMEAVERGDVALDEEGRFRGQVYTFQGAVDNLKMNPDQMASSGFRLVTREGGRGDMALAIDENNMETGWRSFVELLANAKTDTNLGFSARKPIMDDLLKALEKGKNAEIGFPTRDEVKAMVNLHGLDEGGIAETSEQKFVGMYVMDINAMRKMELDPKNRSYTIGLSGFQELIMFEEPMTQEEFEAKPRTTVVGGGGKSFTSGTRALASLNRGGNVHFSGMETWQKSQHGGYASALAAIGLKLTDKYGEVNLLQKDIEGFNKARVNASEDFIMAVDLMYGRTAARLQGLEEVQGLLQDRMKASGINSDMLSDYLYAKHAVERNIQIHKNNPDNFTGSGQTNEWADETIEKLKSKEMDSLANMVYSIIENTQKIMVEYGLETQERIDAWNDMYEFYVPLAGIATDEKNEHSIAYPNGGAGMAVYGNTIKRAKGRKSEVKTNIVAQVIMQNAMTIQMAEKNKAIRTLFELALNNPNENVWAIVDGKNPLTALDDSGKPRAMTVAEMKLNPHTVAVRIDGEQKFIYFKDAHYANTLNGMTVERAKFFARAVNNVTGWLRGVFTIYDPSFFLVNFGRDLEAAIPNALAETERTDGYIEGVNPYKFTAEVMKNIPAALSALVKYQAFGLAMDPMIEKYLDEMINAGGMTGWGMTKDLNQIMTELERASKLGADQAAQEFDIVMGSPKKFLKYIEGINDAFEQATRLGAYMTARQNGVSIEKAAQLAKNVTVNFNRGGEWQFLSSVYLFFNASVQGSARLFRSMFYLKDARKANGELDSWYKRITLPQKIAFAFTTFSGLITMMNLAVSGRDEDGDEELWYNKISDYEKERNIIIMHPNGKSYSKIPLPYGYNVFNNFGVAAVETSTGNRDMWSATGFLANSLVSSFSPISFGQSKDLSKYAMKAAAPTVLKPFVDVAVNESYFGTQIYQERLPFSTTPNSELSFRSPELVEDFFKWMNKASGGSEYRSGEYDYNPDAAWYIFEYFMGGTGKFVTESGELFNNVRDMVRTGEKIDMSPNDLPIVKKIYGEPGKYYDFDLFKERSFEVQQMYREAEKAPIFEKDRYEGVYTLYDLLKTTTDVLELLRAERKNARNYYKNPTKRANAIKDIEERERAAMARFNMYYEKIRGEK